MSTIPPLLAQLQRRESLSYDEAYPAFCAIMAGEEEPTLIAALLVALSVNGEEFEVINAACAAMQNAMTPLVGHEDAMDVVGTGGDGQHTLNISTATALVVAGCGVKIAKHGSKAASSLSGSSDVLSALGVSVDIPHKLMHQALAEVGMSFMWAPLFHTGMKHVAPIRQALKVPTIFNFLGPMCNPARVKRLLLGVARKELLQPMVETLNNRGCIKVWGVHGAEGLDEFSITGENTVVALENGKIHHFTSHPEDAGLPVHPLEAIRGGDPHDNAQAIKELVDGKASAYRDVVLYNAAAALIVAERADTLVEGVAMAAQSLDSGAAKRCLGALVRITHS